MFKEIKPAIIFVSVISLFIILQLFQENSLKKDFCMDNPNAKSISASDYTAYQRFLVTGNKQINISDPINCEKYFSNNETKSIEIISLFVIGLFMLLCIPLWVFWKTRKSFDKKIKQVKK